MHPSTTLWQTVIARTHTTEGLPMSPISPWSRASHSMVTMSAIGTTWKYTLWIQWTLLGWPIFCVKEQWWKPPYNPMKVTSNLSRSGCAIITCTAALIWIVPRSSSGLRFPSIWSYRIWITGGMIEPYLRRASLARTSYQSRVIAHWKSMFVCRISWIEMQSKNGRFTMISSSESIQYRQTKNSSRVWRAFGRTRRAGARRGSE